MGTPMARYQRISSGGIGAAPVTANWRASRPSSSRTLLNATSSRNAQVASSSAVAVPAVRRSTIGMAAATASSNFGLGVRVGGQRGLDAGVELLPHPGHAEHRLRVDLAGVGADLRRVGARRHLEAAEAGEVVAGHPLGDVGHRQVRDRPEPGRVDAQQVEVALGRPDDVVVREHHALGRARGAGRVDDGGQHVGGQPGGGRVQVDRLGVAEHRRRQEVGAGDTGGVEQHDHVLERRELVADHGEPLGVAHVLDDGDLGAAVAGQVADLLGRRRVVDGDGRGPAHHDGHVDDVELGDVAHHQHDPVARAHAEGAEAGGGAGHPFGHLAVGDLHPGVAVLGPQRHLAGHGRDRLEPAPGDGLALHLGIEGRCVDLVPDRLHDGGLLRGVCAWPRYAVGGRCGAGPAQLRGRRAVGRLA